MRLWHIGYDNGETEPWLRDNDAVFEGRLDWNSWLFGIERWDRAWILRLGPISIIYWSDTP